MCDVELHLRLVVKLQIPAELIEAVAPEIDRRSRCVGDREAADPEGMLYRPRRGSIRRTSAVRATRSNAESTISNAAASPTGAQARLPGRTWFKYCVVASRSKYSTALADHPVTSAASCSSTDAVPLRRRYRIVLATKARLLNREPGRSVMPCAPTSSAMYGTTHSAHSSMKRSS
jgi:hypothetical protein